VLNATVGTPSPALGRLDAAWDGATFTVTPPLPLGMNLDALTGVISGTPLNGAVRGDYQVTATRGSATATVTLTITVNDAPRVPLVYTAAVLNATVGTPSPALGRLDAAWDGATFTVTPPLPLGLNLNALTGVISGTPIHPAARGDYRVTATRLAAAATVTLTITVNDAPRGPLVYTAAVLNATVGIPSGALGRMGTGWDGSIFTVTPPLPLGLNLNALTGVISGTPIHPAARGDYRVTATRRAAAATATITITVNPEAPRNLTYTTLAPTYLVGAPVIPTNTPRSLGGAVDTYQVAPPLPAGLVLDAATGILSGTATTRTARQNYTVTATNAGGSTMVVLSIAVDVAGLGPAVTLAAHVTAHRTHLRASIPDQGHGARYAWTVAGGMITAGVGTREVTFTAGAPGPLRAEVVVTIGAARTVGFALSTVVPAPDATLTLPDPVHPRDRVLEASVPAVPGHTYQWRILASTCAAAIRGAANTATLGLDTGDREGHFTVEVTVQNEAADHRTTNRVVHVRRGTWVTKDARGSAEPNPARVSATVLEPDGRVLVVGGAFPLPMAPVRTLVAAAIYDPATNRWAAATLPVGDAFLDHTATPLADHTILLLGQTAAGNRAMRFDPATNAWTDRTPMGTARTQHTATLLDDGRVVVIGGQDPVSLAPLRAVEVYDPATNAWTAVHPMARARAGHTATLKRRDGRVLVIGGNVPDNRSELYDKDLDTWVDGPRTSRERIGHTATQLVNNDVLVVGGQGAAGATAELYDPDDGVNGSFTRVAAPMAHPRRRHTATLLANNDVLIAGGEGGVPGTTVRPSAIYDYRVGTWSATGDLQGNRIGHAAVLLKDDTVLAVRGVQADTASERYMVVDPLGGGAAGPGGAAGGGGGAGVPRPTAADFAELGLAPVPRPTPAQVRAAYRALSLTAHPDRIGAGVTQAQRDRWNRILDAYQRILAHPAP
jgi:hypothetical protein